MFNMTEGSQAYNILTGNLDNIPPLPKTTVKLYICSNAGEFDPERRYLWNEVLPNVQHHCLQHGLDVMFVDMLLGIKGEPTLDPDGLEVRMRELEICGDESIGPFFLAFVGDKYGTIPAPRFIDEIEYKRICDALTAKGKKADLFNTWYQKDNNAIPPHFRLNYHKTDELNEDTHWLSIQKDILHLLQSSGTVSRDPKGAERFQSVLEREIRKALKISPGGCLFVMRNMQAPEPVLYNSSGKSSLVRVKELIERPFSHDTPHPIFPNIEQLRDDIESNTKESNILYLDYKLVEDKSDRNCRRTQDDNIENFIAAVTSKINELVDKSAALVKVMPETPFKSYNCIESLIHLHHCAKLHRETPLGGCEKTFSKLQSMLINGSRAEHQLTILKCPNGCSKARMMAKLCHRARELFGRDAILIPVFVGLTTRSCIIEDIFRSICVQINLILKQEMDIETYSLQKLTSFFHGLTNRVSKSLKQLLILIDSLENLQISPNFEYAQVDWLAAKLPPKFHIIVSCSSNENLQITKRLESKLLNPDVIVYVGKMTSEECRNMLHNNLAKHKRKLTNEQYLAVIETLSEGQCPFMVEAITNCAIKWTCDDKINDIKTTVSLPKNTEHLLTSKLDYLEAQFSKTVISAVCNYITLSRYGLTEIELLDCLSSKDSVLLSLYDKEAPDVLRFPYQAWSVIKEELDGLLTRRHIYGRTLLRWGYKCCSTVARQRYLADPDEIVGIHRDIADLFLEVWKTNNPFLKSEENEMCQEDMDRLLCPQPLVYSDTKYNTRRLQELWYHLMKAGDIARFKEHTFCCFEYLLAMADGDHIQTVINNLEIIRTLLVDSDIHLLSLTIQSSGVGLHSSPLQLANEIIGRMRQIKEYFPLYIEPLVSQCMEWCDSYNHPILVPLTTWLDKIHLPFVASVMNLPNIAGAELLPNGQHVLIASANRIQMYHIASKRMVKSFQGHTGPVTCLCLSASRWSLVSGAKDRTVFIWDINSETCKQAIRGFESQVTCLVTTLKDDKLICGFEDGTIQVRDTIHGSMIKTLSCHKKKVTAIKLCKADTILISGSLDSKLFLFYTADWSTMNVISNEILSPIVCLDVSQDSTFLMAGCDNGSLHVVAMATGSIAQSIQRHQGVVNSVAICSDCHHCVVATSSGLVYLYNFRTTEILDVFKGHSSSVVAALLTHDQQIAVTVSKNDVFAWSLLKRFTKETYQDIHSGPVTCLAITADGRRLISGSEDGLLKSWNLDICDFADNFVGHSGPITCLAISSDHSFAISGSVDTTLKVWSLILATIITNYRGHEREVCGAYVLSDRRLVLSMEVAQKVHLWRAEDGLTLRLYAGPTHLHTVSPNSQFCISGAGDQRLQIWSLTNGSIIKEVSHTDKITCLTCSSNSQYLVTGSVDRSMKVWELATGKIVQIMVEHSSSVRCLAITDNNETVLSGGEDGIILVCSLSLGTTEKKLCGHFDSVTVIRLSSDNVIAVSGSVDNTVRIWNFRRGVQVTMLDTHYPVNDLVMTETGERIAVKLADNSHLPILCLHNTPSKTKTAVTISIETASTSTTKTHARTVDSGLEISDSSERTQTLPIKPKPPLRPRVSVVFPLPNNRRRMSSVSSIPQIIQHSPIKAPIKSTVQAQEKRRIKFPGRKLVKPKCKPEGKEEKRSSVCEIL